MKSVVFTLAVLAAWPQIAAAQQIPLRISRDDARRFAHDRNPTVAAARAAVDATAGDQVTARARPNPALTVESFGYPAFASQRPPFLDGQELSVRVDQEFETAGKRRLRVAASDAAVSAGRFAASDVVRLLDRDVDRAYLQLMLAVADARTSAAALAEVDRLVALNKALAEKGEISGADFRRVQLERLRFADDNFAADLALRNARAGLLALMNASDLTLAIEPTEALARPDVNAWLSPTPAQPSAIETAAAVRPDLQSARAALSQADSLTRLQRALRTPSVTFGAGYVRDFGTSAVIVGATIPLPLFNRNAGGVARATAEQRQAEARVASVELGVRLDVQQALNGLRVNAARVDYIEQEHLKNAGDVRDVVLASYQLGATSLLDVLDAQRVYRDTVRTYNRALFDEYVSLADLQVATSAPDGGR